MPLKSKCTAKGYMSLWAFWRLVKEQEFACYLLNTSDFFEVFWCYSWIRWDLPASFCVVFDFLSCVEESLSMNELRQFHTSHVHVPSDKQIQVYILRVSEFNVSNLQVPRFLYVVWDCSCVSRDDSCPNTPMCASLSLQKEHYLFKSRFDRCFSLRYVSCQNITSQFFWGLDTLH